MSEKEKWERVGEELLGETSQVKFPVFLSAYEWHVVLNMLENYLSVKNANRFSGVSPDNAMLVFEHIATQLANQQRNAE